MKLELFLMSSYFIIILHECVKNLFFFNWNLLNFELKIGSIIKKNEKLSYKWNHKEKQTFNKLIFRKRKQYVTKILEKNSINEFFTKY